MDDDTAIDKHDGMARQLMTVMEEAGMISTSVHIMWFSWILARKRTYKIHLELYDFRQPIRKERGLFNTVPALNRRAVYWIKLEQKVIKYQWMVQGAIFSTKILQQVLRGISVTVLVFKDKKQCIWEHSWSSHNFIYYTSLWQKMISTCMSVKMSTCTTHNMVVIVLLESSTRVFFIDMMLMISESQ